MINLFTLAVSGLHFASFKGKKRLRTNHPKVTAPSFMTRPAGVWPFCFAISCSSRSLALNFVS